MIKKGLLLVIILAINLSACSIVQPGKSSASKNAEYSEDLSAYSAQPSEREQATPDTLTTFVEADSTSLPVTDRLNYLLDTAAAYSRATTKHIDGFTIQVYGGNDRTLAKDFQIDILRNFPDAEPKMVFEQPNYKVRIGQYYTRLEAQEFFKEVKAVYPKAILIPTRILLENKP